MTDDTTRTDQTQSFVKRFDWELAIVDLTLLAFALFLFNASSELGQVARRAPMWILATIIFLLLIDLGLALYHARPQGYGLEKSEDAIDASAGYQFLHLGGFVVCGILVYTVGYRIATPVFLTGFMLINRVSLKILVPVVIGMTLFVLLVFDVMLNIR